MPYKVRSVLERIHLNPEDYKLISKSMDNLKLVHKVDKTEVNIRY